MAIERRGEMDPAMKDYLRRRVDNIKAQVTVADVLAHYGIDVRTTDREFQFPCPLHGDGQDNSYSARMYPDNNDGSGGTYCFACHKSRDCVRWVQDREGIESFGKALSFVERAFHVRDVPRPYYKPGEGAPETPAFGRTAPSEAGGGEDPTKATLAALGNVERVLSRAVADRPEEIGLERATKLFFALDTARYELEEGGVEPDKAKQMAGRIWEVVRKL